MKILFTLITAFSIINFSGETESTSDKITGSFFSNIYSCGDLENDLNLVSEIPKEFSSGEMEYKPEYDVGWKFDFLENGEIKITRLFAYYCGEIAILDKGNWKKIGQNQYNITLEGECYDEKFSKQKKYSIVNLETGIRKLKIQK